MTLRSFICRIISFRLEKRIAKIISKKSYLIIYLVYCLCAEMYNLNVREKPLSVYELCSNIVKLIRRNKILFLTGIAVQRQFLDIVCRLGQSFFDSLISFIVILLISSSSRL